MCTDKLSKWFFREREQKKNLNVERNERTCSPSEIEEMHLFPVPIPSETWISQDSFGCKWQKPNSNLQQRKCILFNAIREPNSEASDTTRWRDSNCLIRIFLFFPGSTLFYVLVPFSPLVDKLFPHAERSAACGYWFVYFWFHEHRGKVSFSPVLNWTIQDEQFILSAMLIAGLTITVRWLDSDDWLGLSPVSFFLVRAAVALAALLTVARVSSSPKDEQGRG